MVVVAAAAASAPLSTTKAATTRSPSRTSPAWSRRARLPRTPLSTPIRGPSPSRAGPRGASAVSTSAKVAKRVAALLCRTRTTVRPQRRRPLTSSPAWLPRALSMMRPTSSLLTTASLSRAGLSTASASTSSPVRRRRVRRSRRSPRAYPARSTRPRRPSRP